MVVSVYSIVTVIAEVCTLHVYIHDLVHARDKSWIKIQVVAVDLLDVEPTPFHPVGDSYVQ